MRYIVILSLAAGLQISASEAQPAPMSPEVKAYLCELAKRDAAVTERELSAMEQAQAKCVADNAELEPAKTVCTRQKLLGAQEKQYSDGRKTVIGDQETSTCSFVPAERPRDCGKPVRRYRNQIADAPERVAKYCTDE